MAAVLTTSGLRREYAADRGLFGVDLHVEQGSVYGLVGPNGAGKTTLLSILAGLRHSDAGSVELAVDRSRLAVCNDVPDFEPWLTAREVVDLARALVRPDTATDAVDAVLDEMGLTDVKDRRVEGFSRGMRQRLGLAAALVGDPEVVILDEPTSALDPVGRREVLDLVGRMAGRRTVLFSSHVLADVQRVCDTVGILHRGRLLWQGPLRVLLDEHVRPSWRLRVRGGAPRVVERLRREPWVVRSDAVGEDEVWLQATSMAAGEQGLAPALAAAGAAVVSIDPVGADLESAFLTVTEDA